mmetsp:Transcript_12167/g.20510  ORF Transcript_12167/g.20510 Transcript_12167/m.20510 type:complete len:282 (-) Transcript_12167:980-1825(-)
MELLVFHIMQWGHLVAGVGQVTFLMLKDVEWFNLAQFIQCIVVPAGYFFIVPLDIYVVKRHYDSWDEDVNYVRIWLLIEIVYFFFWILNGIIFVTYAYIVKFKSISKNEALLAMDDNVWNDKDTDDFLRYLKFEYFLVSFVGTFIATEIFTGFTNLYNLDNLGARDFNQVGIIYTILLGLRAILLLQIFYMLRTNHKVTDDFVSKDNKPQSRIIFIISIQLLSLVAVTSLFFSNDSLSSQNKACKIWVQTEMVAIALEIPFTFLQNYLLVKKQEQIAKAIQ